PAGLPTIEKQRAMTAKSDNLENLERRRPRLRNTSIGLEGAKDDSNRDKMKQFGAQQFRFLILRARPTCAPSPWRQEQQDDGHRQRLQAVRSAATKSQAHRRPMRLSTIGLPLVTAWILWALARGKGC